MHNSENLVPSFNLQDLFRRANTTFNIDTIQASESVEVVDKYPDIPKLNPATLVPSLNPIMVVDGAGLDKVAAYLARVNEYTLDYETNCVDRFFHRRARTLQLGDRNEQYIIDLLAFAGSKERLIASQGLYRKNNTMSPSDYQLLEPVVSVIRPSLESNSHLKVGHYLQFEYEVSKWCLGIRAWNFYCTYLAERNITNGLISVHQKDFFGLDDLVRRYCKFQISKESQTTFDLESPLTDEQIVYCALDIRLPGALKGSQEIKIKRDKLDRAIRIDMDAIPAFGDMHLNGMFADPDKWKRIISDNERDLKLAVAEMDRHFIPVVGQKMKWDQAEIDRLKNVYEAYKEKSPEEIFIDDERRLLKRKDPRYAELGEKRAALEAMRAVARDRANEEYKAERTKGNAKIKADYAKMEGDAAINYNAPAQLLKALHDGPFGLNSKNFKSSGDDEMEKHAGIPVIKAVREYRSLKTALKMFGYRWVTSREEKDAVSKKFGFVDPDTGRIHAKFSQFGADTGRPSCTSPNMLNIPKEDRYRWSFISRPGHDLVDKDCSGQELCVLVEYTQEPAMIDAFRRKKDVHSISAEKISPLLWKQAANMTESMVMVDGDIQKIPPCAYFHNDKEKCKCPKHKEMRARYKALTLGKVMGKTVYSFAQELGMSKEETQKVLDAWDNEFSLTEKKLVELRNLAYDKKEARTRAGRRRIITPVSYEKAKKAAQEKYKDRCTQERITQTMQSMIAGVKREGGNVCFQGTAADQMLLAMGCGYDPNGKPYLWHVLEPKYDAKQLLYLYDEFLVEAPEEVSASVDADVEDAIIRSGAEFVKSVPMSSEGMVSKQWQK